MSRRRARTVHSLQLGHHHGQYCRVSPMLLPLDFVALATHHDDYLMLVSAYVALLLSPALLHYVNVYKRRFFRYGVHLEIMPLM